jgi:hypothetical protein
MLYWQPHIKFLNLEGFKYSMMKYGLLILAFTLASIGDITAQVYTDKVVGKKNDAVIDSLKNSGYPYTLPIWGAKATAMGYKLPLSAGLSVNYFSQESDLIIENLLVGFNNGPLYDLDELVRFDKAVAGATAVNLRPDIWLLPFLNVYAIFSRAKTSTSIDAGLWIPDTNNMRTEIASISTTANFDATAFGLGMTPTIGVGGGWMALDMNFVWTDVSALNKPVFTFVFGPRLGKSFQLKKPDQNIAVWVGGFRVKLSSSTVGSLPLNDILPTDGLQEKVDNGIVIVGERQMEVDEWWNGLSTVEQNNPVNKAKYATASRTLEKAGNVLNSIDGALNDGSNATVQYSLEKRVKDMWNFVVGSQFQLNKHLMLRAEYGFLGSRTQFLGSIQYRFGI